jgi:methanogen extracellular protein (TIGR04279 family)
MRRIRVLLLLVCLLSVSIGIKPNEAQESSQVTSIDLEGTYPIRMPNLSIGANWTYPYAQIPVLRENRSINGSIFSGANGSAVKICITHFNISEFLNSPSIMLSHKNCSGPSLALNLTQEANFTLAGINNGLYTLSVYDVNSSQELSALQLFVTKENLSLQLPASISAGEPLKVKANISGLNQSKIFGAVMISTEDYDNMSLSLTSNNSGSGYNSTLKLGDKVKQLPGLTSFSSDMAMNLIYLLPSNSAVGVQESLQSEVELFLLTDAIWQKGDYILTCAVYSKKEGLLDLKQEQIMVT